MALFSGQKQDVVKMTLGVAIYVCYFLGYAHLNKWLYIPLDIIIVGGAIETGKARSTVHNGMFEWTKRFGHQAWWRNMKYHGISGTANMLFGHLTWLAHDGFLPSFLLRPCQGLFLASTPVVAFTAYHMGSVAMGSFRVDAVYKVGAIIWMLPFVRALANPLDIDCQVLLLGFAQAFCFVRIMSPLSFTVLGFFEHTLKMPPSEAVLALRWDVAASCGIISGMLLGLPPPLSYALMLVTMLVGFGVAPLLFSDDHAKRIRPGQDGSSSARHIDRDLFKKVLG